MKTIKLLLIALLFSFNSFGQEKFIFNKQGLTDFVVVNIDSLSNDQIYNKTINWIKESYTNPDEVIKTSIDGDKVRIEGFKDNLICISALGMATCYGGVYTITISCKNGKYKFDPSSLTYRSPASQYTSGGIHDFYLNDGSPYYKKNGKIRGSWKLIPKSVTGLFNDLNLSLKNYLLKNSSNKAQEDW